VLCVLNAEGVPARGSPGDRDQLRRTASSPGDLENRVEGAGREGPSKRIELAAEQLRAALPQKCGGLRTLGISPRSGGLNLTRPFKAGLALKGGSSSRQRRLKLGSVVAKATKVDCLVRYAALKGRAKFTPPLRGEKRGERSATVPGLPQKCVSYGR
jgi:hypothetical protein